MTAPLISDYDTALFDLDGVVYLGPDPVLGAVDGLAALSQLGCRLAYVTNNAARPPHAVVEHLRELGIELADEDVITSGQAAAHLLLDRFGPGAKILAVGGGGVLHALDEAGLVAVFSAEDKPDAVMQGYDAALPWTMITEAAIAVQRGAHWLATNTDPTRPTDRGLVPGNGAAVAAVRTAVDVDPQIAGKPSRPLIDEALLRTKAKRAIFVGDRLDTDIEGAVTVGLDSLLVFSGSHGPRELVTAGPHERPTQIGWNLAELLQPRRVVQLTDDSATCNDLTISAVAGACQLSRVPHTQAEILDGVLALAQLCWRSADRGETLDPEPALTSLTALT